MCFTLYRLRDNGDVLVENRQLCVPHLHLCPRYPFLTSRYLVRKKNSAYGDTWLSLLDDCCSCFNLSASDRGTNLPRSWGSIHRHWLEIYRKIVCESGRSFAMLMRSTSRLAAAYRTQQQEREHSLWNALVFQTSDSRKWIRRVR